MKTHSTYLFLSLQLSVAVILFVGGFLPSRKYHGNNSKLTRSVNSPGINNETLNNPTPRMKLDILEKSHANKLILMVIDALRYDFIDDMYMPYLYQALTHHNSCLLKVKVDAPTVTMPRIKALMSGNIPGYSDIIFNLLEQTTDTDNLLLQAKKKGLLSVFYGDKTWLDLYPNVFNRSEGTTSFNVTDFTEVDNNVTRNLIAELENNDWNLMILHYLGLDHIGHIEGPFSSLIKPKLLEMDNIISMIHSSMNNVSEKAVFLICSDHGMKDTGSHGGTSPPEIFVPYAFLNYNCDNLRHEEINQVDITPFLSVLLGLPIPAESIGVLHYKLLHKELDILSVLNLLRYNALHMKKALYHYEGSTDFINLLNSADMMLEKLHLSNDSIGLQDVLDLYQYAQKQSSTFLIKKSVNYNEYMMYLSIIIFFQILFHLIFDSFLEFSEKRLIFFSLCIILNVYCSEGNIIEVHFLSQALLLFNFFLLKPNGKVDHYIGMTTLIELPNYFKVFRRSYLLKMLLLTHLATLASSSFIEEEHTFWYFIFASYLLYKLSSNKWIMILMAFHIFFKNINSTGVKYGQTADISDWLNNEHNSLWLIVFFLTGMFAMFFWSVKVVLHTRDSFKIPDTIYLMIMSISVALLKLNQHLIKEFFFPVNGYFIGYSLIWTLSFIRILLYLLFTKPNINFHCFHIERYRSSVVHIIDGVIYLTIFQICLTLKPHNVFIVPCILIYSTQIKKIWNGNILILFTYHLILGNVCYFYQGNSNNLSTIDISVGFLGHHNPSMLLSGYVIFINTFGSQMLSMLLFFRHMYVDRSIRFNEIKKFKYITLTSTIYMFTYAVIISYFRDHLFIWSVFAPKLIYLASLVLLYCLITITILFIDISYFVILYVIKLKNLCN